MTPSSVATTSTAPAPLPLPALEDIIALVPGQAVRDKITAFCKRSGLQMTEQVIAHNPWFYRAEPGRLDRYAEYELSRALRAQGLELSTKDDPSVDVVVRFF